MVFVSRFLPLIRAAFPYAAGVAEMPYWRFAPMAALGSLFLIGGLAVLGREVGSQWQAWRHHLEYVDYVGAVLLVAAIVYLVVRSRRGGPGDGSGPSAERTAGAGAGREPAADVVRD